MKSKKCLPIPQKEFGFTPDTFNLFQEHTGDGELVAREHEELQKAREFANAAQAQLFQTEDGVRLAESVQPRPKSRSHANLFALAS